MSSLDVLEEIKAQALSALESAITLEDIETWEKGFLGRKGTLTQQTRMVGQLPAELPPRFVGQLPGSGGLLRFYGTDGDRAHGD